MVVAIYGIEVAQNEWQPTIDFLQSSLPQYEFNLIPVPPIELNRIKKLVASQKMHFIITQPAIYVDLELNFGISRILTMVKKGGPSEFGSTLFTRSDSGIKTIKDLHGKIIGGIGKLGFGGWLIGYKDAPLKELHIGPYKDYGIITVRGFIAQHMIETVILFVLAISILLMAVKIYFSNIALAKEISACKQTEVALKNMLQNSIKL